MGYSLPEERYPAWENHDKNERTQLDVFASFLPSDNEEGEPCTLVSPVPPVPPLIETQALKQGGHSTPVLLVRKPGLIRLRESVKNKWPGSKLAEPEL